MNDTIIIAASIFLSAYMVAAIIYLAFRQNLKLKEKQFDFENKVRMDDFRSHMERQLLELNKEFSTKKDRFDELNHMVVSGQGDLEFLAKARPHHSQFLEAHGIDAVEMEVYPRTIFVLTPFHPDFDEFFSAVTELGQQIDFKISRGDERVEKSDIFTQILHGIVRSRFVIANITGRNPNVFYELGVAHALDKEVILVAHSDAEIPFDLRSKRIIFYDKNSELQGKLAAALARMANA